MNTDLNYLLHRAMDLQLAGQEAQAMDVYRQIVSIDPSADEAWFNLGMLQRKRRDSQGACDAFESFLRVARTNQAPLIEFAVDYLRSAGRALPDELRANPVGDADSTIVMVTIDDGTTSRLVSLRNDSGVQPAALQAVQEEFTGARTWAEAFLTVREHPELLSEISLTLLRVQAQHRETERGVIAQTNLRVLERARQVGAETAFAEAEHLTPAEFRRLLRAIDDIQPAVQALLDQLKGANPSQLERLLRQNHDLLEDQDIDLLLAYLWRLNGQEGRQVLQWLRGLVNHYRSGMSGFELPDAVEQYRRSVNAIDERPPNRAALDNLAAQGEQLIGKLVRVDPVIRSFAEHDLALVLSRRYVMDSDTADLTQATILLRSGLSTLHAHPHLRVPHLINLAVLLLAAFERTSDPGVLSEARAGLEQARAIEGDFGLSSPLIHSMLGSILYRLYQRQPDQAVLDESIALLDRAVEARDADSRERVQAELNLANPLLVRGYSGDAAAVERVVRMADRMREWLPPADPLGPAVLLLIGRANRMAYEWSPDVNGPVLERAIEAYESMLRLPQLSPMDIADGSGNLANALRVRGHARGVRSDFDRAVALLRTSLELLPAGHVDRGLRRSNLADVLFQRYQARRVESAAPEREAVDDLRTAIDLYREVLTDEPDTETGRDTAANLGNALFTLLELLWTDPAAGHDSDELERVFDEAQRRAWDTLARTDPAIQPRTVLDISWNLGLHYARFGAYEQAAEALAHGVAALESADALATGRELRGRLMARASNLVQLAAYCHGRVDQLEQAVTILESSRARSLRDALKLDVAHLDALAAVGHSALARQYATIARELTTFQQLAEGSLSWSVVVHIRELRAQVEDLGGRIRQVAGFANFGQRLGIDQIYSAATETPLIYVCVTDVGGLGFVVAGGHDPGIKKVELPGLRSEIVAGFTTRFLAALRAYREFPRSSERVAFAAVVEDVTGWLGRELMAPLAAALDDRATRAALLLGERLALLPAAAAWTPGDDGQRVYVDQKCGWQLAPSAQTLLAVSETARQPRPQEVLIVANPEPVQPRDLPGACVEATAVRRSFTNALLLHATEATLSRVLSSLPNYRVVHFASHAIGLPDTPLDSHILLANDEQLQLRTLLSTRTWKMRLCVLSACDAQQIGASVPDDVVSLPAGLMQVGAAGVIASQWPVRDVAATVLMAEFYNLWSTGLDGNEISPGTALRLAQTWLRSASRQDIVNLLWTLADDTNADAVRGLVDDLPLSLAPLADPLDWAAFVYTGL